MKDDDLVPGVDKPRRWQYPVAALVILLLALVAWLLHRAGIVG
jgi:hypothetical protein